MTTTGSPTTSPADKDDFCLRTGISPASLVWMRQLNNQRSHPLGCHQAVSGLYRSLCNNDDYSILARHLEQLGACGYDKHLSLYPQHLRAGMWNSMPTHQICWPGGATSTRPGSRTTRIVRHYSTSCCGGTSVGRLVGLLFCST
jgi:hypothetical protein